MSRVVIFALATLLGSSSMLVRAADESESISPVMNTPDRVAYEGTFGRPQKLNKADWQARQGTRWEVADGVLRGQPSSPERQATRPDHKGLEPRIASRKTPSQFIARFSLRFIGGEETKLVPLVEFGHHHVRLKFSRDGVRLLCDHKTVLLAESDAVKFESGKWYHLLAEKNGDEFVVQFADGPTLYGKHPSLTKPVTGADGLGIAGPRGGRVEIDNVTLWTIKPRQARTWPAVRATIPTMKPKKLPSKRKGKKTQ